MLSALLSACSGGGGTTPAPNVGTTPTISISNSQLRLVEDFTTARSIATVTNATEITVSQSRTGVVTVSTSLNSVSVSSIANANGQTTLTIRINDGTLSDSTEVSVTVTAVNDPPTLTVSTTAITLIENFATIASIIVTTNDIEGDTLTVTVTESTTGVVTVTTSSDGVRLSNIANANGRTTLTITVSDDSASISTEVLIFVTGVNDPPVLSIPTAILTESEDFSGLRTVATAMDVDGDALTFTVIESTTGVITVTTSDTGVNVSSILDINGQTTLTISVNDGANTVSTQVVVIVTPVNDQPTLTVSTTAITLTENFATIASIIVTTNDIEGDTLTVTVTESTTGVVTVTTSSDGVRLSNITNANGRTTLTVRTTDSGGLSAVQLITVNVTTAVSAAIPMISVSTSLIRVQEDFITAVTFITTATDADGDAVFFSLSSSERLVDAVLSTRTGGISTITLTPVANAFGTATLTVHAIDVGGQSSSTEVVVVIDAVNNDRVSFSYSTSIITLTAPGNQLERYVQNINISNPDAIGIDSLWAVFISGDPIFSTNPTPVVSFTTNRLTNETTLSSATHTAQLYFSIAPNQTGTGTLTVHLVNLVLSLTTKQILMVQVNPVDVSPVISQANPNLQNLIVHGGHLYANSVTSSTQGVSEYLATASALGGHLININTIEEMNFVRSINSGLESHDAWFGMVLPRRTFPGELSWVTNDSTIAYGFVSTSSNTTGNITIYPGHFPLNWENTVGLVSNRSANASTVFNWTVYSRNIDRYFLLDDGGDGTGRYALYEFPQGLAPASINTIPVKAGSSATVRLTGIDLNGDAISTANWSAIATTGSFNFANVTQSSGVQMVDFIYTPSVDFNGQIRAEVGLQVNGLMTTRSLSFFVGSATPTLTMDSSTIVLTENSTQSLRYQRSISNVRIPGLDGLADTLDVQWRVTHSGDAIFSANPAPVVSFTTHVLTTTDRIGSTAKTAQLYFTIAPDRVGTATLTVHLSNQATSGMSQQTLVVQVNPMSHVPPVIVPLNSSIDNLAVNGGRLYANSRTLVRAITSFVAESRSFGGHLLNINTIEELTYLNSTASSLILNESWYGLVLQQRTFPGELSWVTHDSTIGYGFASANGATNLNVYPGHFTLNWNDTNGLIANRTGNAATVFNWTIYADGFGYFLLDDVGDTRLRRALYEFPQGLAPTSDLLSMRPPVPVLASSSATVRLTGFDLSGDAISTANWTAVDPNGGVARFSNVSQSSGVQVVDMIYTPLVDFHGLTTVVATLQLNGLSTTRGISFSVDGQPSIALSTHAITLAEDFNTSFDIGVSVTDHGDGVAIPFRVIVSSTEVANISTSANAIQLSAVLNANGTFTLTVQATDSAGQTASTLVVVAVQAVNDPPTLSLSAENISIVGRYTSIIINTTATDIEDGVAPISVQLSSTGVVKATHSSSTIVLRPVFGVAGQTTITVSATDSGGQTISRPISFSVSITSSTAPVVNVDRNLIVEAEGFVTPVLIQTSATDADGDALFFSLSSSTHIVDAVLTFSPSGTGTITNLIALTSVGDLNGTATLTIHATDVGGQTASTEVVVVVTEDNNDPISFTVSTSAVTLSAIGSQLDRNIHNINISNIDSRTVRAQWQITASGSSLFSANPAPVVSFTTNRLSIESMLTSTTHTAQLYFTIAPNQTGRATLTVRLTDLTANEMSSQTIVVQVNPMNVPPVIAQTSQNLDNLMVNGGRLYANSVMTDRAVRPFLAEARRLGGHLININSAEEHAFVHSPTSLLEARFSWYGLVLPQQSFPGELFWVTHDSTIAYGYAIFNNANSLNVYPGHYALFWGIVGGLTAHRSGSPLTVFNWTYYTYPQIEYFLIDDIGDALARRAIYEFPQGLAPASFSIVPVISGSSATVRLTGIDLNGDAINTTNWSAVAATGTVNIANVAQRSGVQIVDLVYTPSAHFSGHTTVQVALQVNNHRTTTDLSFFIGDATPTFTIASSTLVLTQNSTQTIRNQQPISQIIIPDFVGLGNTATIDAQWRVTQSGDAIFSTQPTPVVSFSTNALTTIGRIGATTQTAQLYFTIAPDRIGKATLTVQLSNLASSAMSQQTLVVQVNPMNDHPPVIVPANSRIENLAVHGGRLYANSVNSAPAVTSFLAEANDLGGHLLNINSIEESDYIYSIAKGILTNESWFGLALPRQTFPGELAWVANDSTIAYGYADANGISNFNIYPGHVSFNWGSDGLIANRIGQTATVFNWTIFSGGVSRHFLVDDIGDTSPRHALYEFPQGLDPAAVLPSVPQTRVVTRANVLLTGFDLNGDTISTGFWTGVDPNGGTVTFSNTRQQQGIQVVEMTYTPPVDFDGPTTVVTSLRVNGLRSTPHSVAFLVGALPTVAVSTIDIKVDEDFTTYSVIHVLANHPSASNQLPFMVSLSSTGVVAITSSTNAIQLSAIQNASGKVTLTIQTSVSADQTASTHVVVTVRAVNDPPILTVSSNNISTLAGFVPIVIDTTATDVEDGDLTFTVQLSRTNVVSVATSTNAIVLTPIVGGSGQTTLTVRITDSDGLSAVQLITVNMTTAVSAAIPMISVSTSLIRVQEDFTTAVTLITTATDADGDAVVFSLSSSERLFDAVLSTRTGGVSTITLTSVVNAYGTATLTVHAIDVGGQSTSTEVVVVINAVNNDPISFKFSTSMITLSAPGNQLERNVQNINISNPDSANLNSSWFVTSNGDLIFSTNPTPVVSFTTNRLTNETTLTSAAHAAQLYFTIAPNQTGTGTLTVHLINLTHSETTTQILTVQVNPVDVSPVIAQTSTNLQNLIVHGGHLYANSVSTAPTVTPFLTKARKLGGHLININTVEEHAFVYTTASGLISQESWYGLVLPQRMFPGELSWITHDSTIAYGFVSISNNTTGNITVYPGHYPLNWENTIGLVSNRRANASTVFNWPVYSRNIDRYFLLDDGGDGTGRHALYEFPQGLAPASFDRIFVSIGSSATARLTGVDLNGDAIKIANWSGTDPNGGTVRFSQVAQSSGVQSVKLVYTPPVNYGGPTTVDVSLQVNGLRTTRSLSFFVGPATPTFTVASSTIVLTENSAQSLRYQQPISNARIPAYDGLTDTLDVQWRVTHSGDAIFSANPLPVVSFTTHVLTTTDRIGSTAKTAQLYFTIAPDRTGTATLTVQLSNQATSGMSQQTLVVQVNPMSHVPPTIVPVNSSIDNLVVSGGRLYANSVSAAQAVTSFLAEARALSGHLLNINTIEELTFLTSTASGLILNESWYGLVLPQRTFPGELSWVTHDSTIGYGYASANGVTNLNVYPGHFALNWGSARGLNANRVGNPATVFNWTIYADGFGYFLLDAVGDTKLRRALYELPQGIASTSHLLSIRPPVLVAAGLSETVRLMGFDLNGDAISTTNWTAVDPNGGVARFSNVSQSSGVQVVDMVYTAPANFNSDTTVVATLQVNGLTTTRAILFTADRPPNIALSTQALTLAEDFPTLIIGTTVTDQVDLGILPFTVRASTSGIVNVSNLGYGIRLSAVQNASGQVILTIQATDSAPQTASTLVVVTVKAVNDPPIIDVSTDNISTVGGFASITIGTTATDVEDVTLPFAVQLSTTNVVNVTTAANAIVLTPLVGGSGRTTLTVLATDSSGQATLRTIAVDVAIVQSTPPVLIVSTNLIRVQEDFTPSVVIQSTATDADGGTLTIFVRSSTNLVNVADSDLVNDRFSITLTPMTNLHGTTTITVDLFDSGGLSASEQIVVIVNSVRDPVSFTFSTPVVNLTGNQLDRNIQRINILNPERETLRAQWQLTSSGDPIFSINPTPVLSFSTNTLTNVTNIATIAETAQLYFSIAPNRVGTATLTAQLTNLTTAEMSRQMLVVQVNPTDVAPMIIQTSTRIENFIVHGGRLYANSVKTASGVTTFLTEAKTLGGHLININTTEEHTFMSSTASGLISHNAWIGMVLPQLEFPGELSWVTHDSTIAYGHASTDGRVNLKVYPGHLALNWQLYTGLFANRGSSRPSVFNWANYSRFNNSYFLIGDRGDGASRRALYEFPQGLAPTSIMPRPIRRDGLSATVRLTGFDLNGDAINESNWSGTDPNGGTVRFSQVSQSSGVQTVDMIYTAPVNFNDHTTVVVTLTVNGLISTTAVSFLPIVPSFTLTTSTIILVENSSKTIRNQQVISNIEIPAYSGTTSSLEFQWRVTQSGDSIFSNKPAPVVSFSTNNLMTKGHLSSTTRTAHLYFSIAPDRRGRATLTVHLSSVTKPVEISQQTIVVQVNPMSDVPFGIGVSTDLQNLNLHGGRLYANSVKTARSVNPFLAEARALGGHLANINTIEEFDFIRSSQSGLMTHNAWFGLNLPQLEFPGELFWVTNDSTIAYGFSNTDGNTSINVYPGHYNLPWFSLFANRGSSRPSVFNWIHYSDVAQGFVLIGDRGDATTRVGLYEFPKGLVSTQSIPVVTSSSVTVRLTVFDLNGDAINLSNLSAIATSGTVSIGNISQSTGLRTIEMVYTAPANFVSQSTVVVSLQVNGSSTSTELSFIPSVPTFTLPSNLIVLTANSSQTIRNTQQISNIEIEGLAGTTRNLNVQWTVTNSGNAIFPTRPAPVVSFSTNAIETNVNLSTTARTAQLYFTVSPDRTGIATLTLELSNAELGIRSSQTMVVQVNPMINEPPVIVPTNPNFANIRLYGGHLYAHSVSRSQAIAPFLAEARAYGGHLANTNSSEEFTYFLTLIRSGITAIDYSWHGLVLPQLSFPGELSWVTNDSTIAYGFASGDGFTNLTTYPGQYRLLWDITTGVFANKRESRPSVFNWVYFADILSNYYSLLGDRGDTRARHGFYEFPQGIRVSSPTALVSVNGGASAILSFTGYDLNGDVINTANWSGTDSKGGTVRFGGVYQSAGVHIVNMTYTAPTNFDGLTTAVVTLQVGGLSTTTAVPFIVNGPPNIALSSHAITLDEDFPAIVVGTTITDRVEGSNLPFSIQASATGMVTISTSANTIRLSSVLNVNGRVTLTVQAADSLLLTTSALIVVNIRPVSDTPTIAVSSDNIATLGGFFPITVQTIVTDIEDGTVPFTVQASTPGVVSVNIFDDAIVLSPIETGSGQVTLTITAVDSSNTTGIETIIVNVIVIPSATPVLTVSTNRINVLEDFTQAIFIRTTATDESTLVVTVSSFTRLVDAVLSTQGISLSAVTNLFGTTTLTVRATDVGGIFDSTEIVVVVQSVNDTPTLSISSQSIVLASAVNVAPVVLTVSAVDVEDATLTMSVSTGQGVVNTTVTNTSLSIARRGLGDNGPIVVLTVTATDSDGASVSTRVTVEVPPVFILTLGIKTIDFAWSQITTATHYRLQSNPDSSAGYVDISTTGIVITPNSTNINQSTAQALVTLHRYIFPSLPDPMYAVKTCNTAFCDPGFRHPEISLNNGQLQSLIGRIEGGFDEEIGKGGNIINYGLGSRFGESVSISDDGNTLAVGALLEDGSSGINGPLNNQAPNSGAVFLFRRNGGLWTRQAYIKASNLQAGDQFGTIVRLSLDGNTLAVGAPLEDSASSGVNNSQVNGITNSGAVYIFRFSGGVWSQQAYIKASNPQTDGAFGYALSLSADGNTLAVGASGEDGSSTGVNGMQDLSAQDSGAVYIFQFGSGVWTQQAYIKASNTGQGDLFGESVSLNANGNTLAVGALREASVSTGVNGAQNDNRALDAGAVYVYRLSGGGVWSQQAYIKASNSQGGDRFGRSVSLSVIGNTLAVGAPFEDGLANSVLNSGAVYVYQFSGVWSQQAYIKASNPGGEDQFGRSISLSGDGSTLAVGSHLEDGSASGVRGSPNDGIKDAGAVYVFEFGNGVWSQQAYVKSPTTLHEQTFGYSVSLSHDGSVLAVGEIQDSPALGTGEGEVYLY